MRSRWLPFFATSDLPPLLLIPVIRLGDLKRNKLASGRMKDLADLGELQ
jgi:hypothetical protein